MSKIKYKNLLILLLSFYYFIFLNGCCKESLYKSVDKLFISQVKNGIKGEIYKYYLDNLIIKDSKNFGKNFSKNFYFIFKDSLDLKGVKKFGNILYNQINYTPKIWKDIKKIFKCPRENF